MLGLWIFLFWWIGRCRRPLRVEEVKSVSLFDLWTGGEFIRTKIYGDVFRCSRTDFCYSPPVLFVLLSLFCGERSFCSLMWRTLSPTPPASRLAPGLTLRFASSPLFALVHGLALGAFFCFFGSLFILPLIMHFVSTLALSRLSTVMSIRSVMS